MAQMPRAHIRLPRRDWGKRLFLLRCGASGMTRARFWRWWKLLGLPRITPMGRWVCVIVGGLWEGMNDSSSTAVAVPLLPQEKALVCAAFQLCALPHDQVAPRINRLPLAKKSVRLLQREKVAPVG